MVERGLTVRCEKGWRMEFRETPAVASLPLRTHTPLHPHTKTRTAGFVVEAVSPVAAHRTINSFLFDSRYN